ncbi:hypothetical protein LCGC14_0413560 [marine sediment metagenome]|uniref:Uncharacterized protein n=1 Tax=marine sediment metagenome TaxID=412755 RepID=A0A0F9SYX1_9ZZZZ
MAEHVPKRIDEAGEEDVQDIQQDISILAKKYIVPIDRIKSIAKPGPGDDAYEELEPDNSRQVESRAHAFLRFIGFPVVAGNDKEFYNPGFDPTGQSIGTHSGQATLKQSVVSSFNSNSVLKSMVETREQDPKDLRSIFVRQDMASSVYSIIMRHVRNFKMFDAGDPFKDDKQDKKNENRSSEAISFFLANLQIDTGLVIDAFTKTPIGPNFSGIRHILHPFVVDPRIDITVMPDVNQIAVPFLLNKEALKLDKGIFVKRPGIELIIRERLRDTGNDATDFFKNVEKLLNNEQTPVSDTDTRTENELRLTVEALLDDNEISQSAIDSDIEGITSVQVRNIQTLVKTIRAIISKLNESILAIDRVKQEINLVPLPIAEGPETGQATLNRRDISNITDIDKRIVELNIKKHNAERRIAAELDLGEFASPFSSSVNDDDVVKISEKLQEDIDQRANLANKAFKAMGDIEIISGEVSGLGLLDILAIYVALWAMDEKSLISMLDDQSFSRLKNFFKPLLKGAAADRGQSSSEKYDIKIALENFEKKLVNVLAFIDREIERQGVAPGEEASGTISADS